MERAHSSSPSGLSYREEMEALREGWESAKKGVDDELRIVGSPHTIERITSLPKPSLAQTRQLYQMVMIATLGLLYAVANKLAKRGKKKTKEKTERAEKKEKGKRKKRNRVNGLGGLGRLRGLNVHQNGLAPAPICCALITPNRRLALTEVVGSRAPTKYRRTRSRTGPTVLRTYSPA